MNFPLWSLWRYLFIHTLKGPNTTTQHSVLQGLVVSCLRRFSQQSPQASNKVGEGSSQSLAGFMSGFLHYMSDGVSNMFHSVSSMFYRVFNIIYSTGFLKVV